MICRDRSIAVLLVVSLATGLASCRPWVEDHRPSGSTGRWTQPCERWRMAGVAAEDPAIRRALTFVERCQNVAADDRSSDSRFDDGGFFFSTTDPVRE